MGSSSGNATQTTRTEPPEYLRGYLMGAAQEVNNNFYGAQNQYYPGQTVTPFSSQTQQALNLTEQRALAGSPTTQAASNYSQSVLGGDYLPGGVKSNPYLDATFNQASLATQNQLASQFAGAGRNIGASATTRGDQLNNLATQIYGGAYDSERQRQQAMVPFATGLDNQAYTDLGQLGQVGATYEDLTGRQMEDAAARWDYNQNVDDVALNNYLSRFGMLTGGAGNTQTTSTPIYRNRTAGALGGASTGASLGSSLGPYGAAIGGILGGLYGAYG